MAFICFVNMLFREYADSWHAQLQSFQQITPTKLLINQFCRLSVTILDDFAPLWRILKSLAFFSRILTNFVCNLANFYFCNLPNAVKIILPSGLTERRRLFLRMTVILVPNDKYDFVPGKESRKALKSFQTILTKCCRKT